MSDIFDEGFLQRLRRESEKEDTAIPDSPVHENPDEYESDDVLTATIRDTQGKESRLVCRQKKDVEWYTWFIDDSYYGLISLTSLSGNDVEEAQSEFELYFGVLYPGEYSVRADWYRYGNRW